MSTTFGYQLVLDELRRAFEKIHAASDVLDTKLQSMLTFGSLIVSVAGTAEVTLQPTNVGILFWIVLVLALVLYLATFWIIVRSLLAHRYLLPVSLKWEELDYLYFGETEEKSLSQLISAYLEVIKQVNESNVSKGRAITHSSYLLAPMVILLLAAVPLGLHWSHLTLIDLWNLIPH